jgi:hypothetical protein
MGLHELLARLKLRSHRDDAHAAGDEYRLRRVRWSVEVEFTIQAADADAARAVNEEALHMMGVAADAGPYVEKLAGTEPSWHVVDRLDWSELASVTPDTAQALFEHVTRRIPDVWFDHSADTTHGGWWGWLRDSYGSAGRPVFPHPAVHRVHIEISDGIDRRSGQ